MSKKVVFCPKKYKTFDFAAHFFFLSKLSNIAKRAERQFAVKRYFSKNVVNINFACHFLVWSFLPIFHTTVSPGVRRL